MPYEMNEEDDLTKILLKYINKKPIEYGGGYCEKSYPVSAIVDIVNEYTEIKAKKAFEAGFKASKEIAPHYYDGDMEYSWKEETK
jgi:hypothetical protein